MDREIPELNEDRRTFIKKVLKGTIAGSLFLVIPLRADDPGTSEQIPEDIPEQIPGIRGREYDMSR